MEDSLAILCMYQVTPTLTPIITQVSLPPPLSPQFLYFWGGLVLEIRLPSFACLYSIVSTKTSHRIWLTGFVPTGRLSAKPVGGGLWEVGCDTFFPACPYPYRGLPLLDYAFRRSFKLADMGTTWLGITKPQVLTWVFWGLFAGYCVEMLPIFDRLEFIFGESFLRLLGKEMWTANWPALLWLLWAAVQLVLANVVTDKMGGRSL